MRENKNFVKNVANDTFSITFVPISPILHNDIIASGSFSQTVHTTKDNTPPMPLFDAHLGGFFI